MRMFAISWCKTHCQQAMESKQSLKKKSSFLTEVLLVLLLQGYSLKIKWDSSLGAWCSQNQNCTYLLWCCSGKPSSLLPPRPFHVVFQGVFGKQENTLGNGEKNSNKTKTKRFFYYTIIWNKIKQVKWTPPDDLWDKGSIDTHQNARSRIHVIWLYSNAGSIITCSTWQFLQAAIC